MSTGDENSEDRSVFHRGLHRLARGKLRPEVEAAIIELEAPLKRLEQALLDLMVGSGLPQGFDPENHLAPGVPRIRPLLVMLSTRAAGELGAEPVDIASAAELLHLAVRVHDAALGRQNGRRRRVARRLLGSAAHWLGGNHLTLRVLEMIRAEQVPEVLGEAIKAMREISEGHALAEELRHRDASVEDYRTYAEDHAGAIYTFCMRAGGLIAEAPKDVVSSLGRYGRHVGIAWHAVEDQWLFNMDSPELTRQLARWVVSGRPIFPIIHALEVDSQLDVVLDEVVSTGEVYWAEELRRRVKQSGAIASTQQLVVEECLAARRALNGVPQSPYRDLLEQLITTIAVSGRSQEDSPFA